MTLKHALLAAAGNTGPEPTDPQFNYVSLLLHGDGTNGAQNNTFTASPTLAPAGGFLAGYFDGNSDYLSVAHNTALDLSSGDWTLEAWVFVNAINYDGPDFINKDGIYAFRAPSYSLGMNSTGFARVRIGDSTTGSGGAQSIISPVLLPQKTWVHLAAVKNGTTITLYQNGVGVASATQSVTIVDTARPLVIGYEDSQFFLASLDGYLSNVRVVKGTAVYTSNFTPPTAPLAAISGTSLLTCVSGYGSTFADASVNNFTVTRNGNATMTSVATTPPGAVPYAGYLDGSGDYLTVPAGAAFAYGTGAFTIEGWVYLAANQENTLFAQTISGTNYLLVGISYGTPYFVYATSGGGTSIGAGITIALNTWAHIAVVREGTGAGQTKIYVNGALSGSGACAQDFSNTTYVPTIGRYSHSATYEFNGYVSNFRVVKGTAVYTSNFAPPSSPLTAISGTSLLTCQSATFLDNSPNAFTVTAYGNATVTSSYILPAITRNGNTTQGSLSPYGNLWSNWFSGGGSDWLDVGGGMPSGQGTEFTLEFWAYATTAKEHAFTQGTTAGTLDFSVNASGAVYVADTGVVTIASSANGAFPYRSWVHIALTRTAGNLYTIYINGVSVGTGTNSTSMTANTTIGKHRGSTSRYFQGYMSNWRVNNTLVYTSNFTPPTAPLTAISGTSLLTCQSNRFRDASANNFTITRSGDVRVTKEAPFLPTAAYSTSTIGGSGYFDGSGDYLTAPVNTAINPGTGDFCFESWAYFTALNTGNIFNGQQNNIGLALDSSNKISIGQSYVSTLLTDPDAATTGQWYHIVVCRSGTTLSLFVNGVRKATATNSTNFITSSANYIGWNGGSSYFSGYLADMRLVKGSSVYNPASTTLIVPTAPLTAITNTSLLLNFTNAGIFDNAGQNDLETVGNAQISTSVKKYGTGSIYLNGGPYLALAATPSMALGTGDFTIEAWVYPLSNNFEVIDFRPNSTNGAYPAIYCDYGTFGYHVNNTFQIYGGTVTLNAWQHIAVVRKNGTTTMYLNGVSVGSFSDGWNYLVGAGRPVIGVNGYATYVNAMNGYIDDLRITKGYARYSANFTPPAAALPDK